MLWDLSCTMDKTDSDGENKRQRLYRCCSNYALSKLIVKNGLDDLWRREIPDSPEFTWYDRFFAKDPGWTDSILIKNANNTKINHIMVSFTNHYNAISIDRLPSKTKIEKYSWYLNNSLLCKSEVSSTTKTFLFLLKTQKNKYSCNGPPAFESGSCRLRFS